MDLMKGKKGVIFGVSNTHGIAYGIAKQLHDAGAEIAFTYAGEAMEKRVKPIAESMGAKIIMSCDVTKEEEVKAVFDECEKLYGKIDFVVHAVAFAKKEDLMGRFIETSKEGWDTALGVSAYSLVTVARHAEPIMNEGGSIFALTYLGSVLSVPSYNVMGVAKAALETSIKYLSADIGRYGYRINGISAGPIKTLSAKGIKDFGSILNVVEEKAPLHKNVTIDQVGDSTSFLFSDMSSAITGEIIHVDNGYSIMGA